MHRNKRGKVDAIALPPLEPANILTSAIDAVPGIDINIQPAWEAYSQTETKRPLTVAVIDTGVDISHPDLQGSIWVNEDEIPGDGIDNDGNGFVDDVNGWNFTAIPTRYTKARRTSTAPMQPAPLRPPRITAASWE